MNSTPELQALISKSSIHRFICMSISNTTCSKLNLVFPKSAPPSRPHLSGTHPSGCTNPESCHHRLLFSLNTYIQCQQIPGNLALKYNAYQAFLTSIAINAIVISHLNYCQQSPNQPSIALSQSILIPASKVMI